MLFIEVAVKIFFPTVKKKLFAVILFGTTRISISTKKSVTQSKLYNKEHCLFVLPLRYTPMKQKFAWNEEAHAEKKKVFSTFAAWLAESQTTFTSYM